MARALIITYYWPPAGGVGVLRWLQMSKYLAQMGWHITVFCPKNAAFSSKDENGKNEVDQRIHEINFPIKEPGKIYQLINPNQKNNSSEIFTDNNTWLKQWAIKLRANHFIPDARMLWIRPSVRFLSKHLQSETYDVTITNGPPHSCHVIGLQLKKKFPELNWVADFRDPWMEIDYFEDLPLSQKARNKHKKLEHEVLTSADWVTTVSPSWAKLLKHKGAKHVSVFTNGYDFESPLKDSASSPTHRPLTITHVGTLSNDRNPNNLWDAFSKQKSTLKVKLIGPIAEEVLNQTKHIKQINAQAKTIPHHVAIEEMKQSDALLLLNNQKGATEGRIPAKVFEYIAIGKPIIYVGPLNNDTVTILKESQMAICFSYEQPISLTTIEEWVVKTHQPNEKLVKQYHRKQIAMKYSQFLKKQFQLNSL